VGSDSQEWESRRKGTYKIWVAASLDRKPWCSDSSSSQCAASRQDLGKVRREEASYEPAGQFFYNVLLAILRAGIQKEEYERARTEELETRKRLAERVEVLVLERAKHKRERQERERQLRKDQKERERRHQEEQRLLKQELAKLKLELQS